MFTVPYKYDLYECFVIFYFDIHNAKLFAMDKYAIRKEFLCYQNKNHIFGLKPVHKLARAV